MTEIAEEIAFGLMIYTTPRSQAVLFHIKMKVEIKSLEDGHKAIFHMVSGYIFFFNLAIPDNRTVLGGHTL